MEPKKNPRKDLNQNKGIYFALGMLLVLTVTYIALEWKTPINSHGYDPIAMNVTDEIIEDAPIFTLKTTPPPPPPVVIPEKIVIEEDDADIVETIVADSDTNQDEIIEVKDVVYEEEPISDEPIPFRAVEDAPIFPGCENESDKHACFQKMMIKHISKVFKYPELEQEMGIQGRVNTMFVIQKDGSIGQVRMRGPNGNLEKEAARIISKLPKMIPGKQRGKAVRVPFSIPITFRLR